MIRVLAVAAAFLWAGQVLPQETQPVNRLAQETSPYLLQHKNNPVDWYPWGEEALARAKKEDKPIFLSIGYSACHWCHVMEHESFENPEIAALMNKYFINIKVDREERPDLDEIYMSAVQGMTGAGGWPMSVFLTTDLKPFYGGTYYPPEDKYGRPGFPRVLEQVAQIWRERRDEVETQSQQVVDYMEKVLAPTFDPGDVHPGQLDLAAQQSRRHYDGDMGGFATAPNYAPKFPHASELSMLLRHHARTGDEESLQMVELTLRTMALGGIYDQLGGGFHRYSTTRDWLVPHFEKMLYDNAQLVRTYAEAYRLTGDALYARIVRETLDYLLREMQDRSGGIYSTQDADSEGVEGKFFVWSKEEVDRLLGEDAEVACLYWGITEGGNWEHNNILSVVKSTAEVAAELDLDEEEVVAKLAKSRAVLLQAREPRVHPGTDDKVLAAWNGLAISAFAIGYQTIGDERYLQAARRTADFVLDEMRADGRLFRTWRQGDARLMGYLEDYAFVADGLLSLFETDFEPRWLEEARALLGQIRTHFLDDSDGNFFFTADDHEKLVTRNKNVGETSTPSGISVAVLAMLRASLLLGDLELEEVAVRAMQSNFPILERSPLSAPSLVLALQLHLGDPREVVVVGEPEDPTVQAFLEKVRAEFPPHNVVTVLHAGNREKLRSLSEIYVGKDLVDGKPAVYVCRRGVCDAPVVDPAKLELR